LGEYGTDAKAARYRQHIGLITEEGTAAIEELHPYMAKNCYDRIVEHYRRSFIKRYLLPYFQIRRSMR